MKEFLFDREHFNENDWIYAVTSRPGWDEPIKFTQLDDCLINKRLPKEKAIVDDFEFISFVSREAYKPDNLWVELDCKFEVFGAPCIVFSNEWFADKNGVNVFRKHSEFCCYKGGVNIWDYSHGGDRMLVKSAARLAFPVEENKKITLRAEFNKGTVKTGIGNVFVTIPFDLPDELHIGVTACEGINSFYAMRFGKLDEAK